VLLLTGASGFIGGHLAASLVAGGERVRCLVRASSDTRGLQALVVTGEGPGVELVRGDLTDHDSLARAVTGCEQVVHCAAMVSDWGTVEEIRAANATASAELGAAAARAGVRRFIHLSTTDVYGNPGGRTVREEYVPGGFANWYAQTKREAEAALERISAETGMELVILRPATVYGPGSTDVVGELATALRGGYLPLIGGGRAVAGLVYVDNLVDAVQLALSRPEAAGEAFNVTDALDVTWRRFSTDLARGLGCRPPRLSLPAPLALGLGIALEEGYRRLRRWTGLTTAPLLSRQAVQVLARDQDFSCAKLVALGWSPRVSYEDGLAATLAWLHAEYPDAP
jgi:nucleoside-diphosphate-sugar epimerase